MFNLNFCLLKFDVIKLIITFYFQTTRKSALLTAAKKAKLKNNPSRVRFSEGVVINGSPLYSVSMLFINFFHVTYSNKVRYTFHFPKQERKACGT